MGAYGYRQAPLGEMPEDFHFNTSVLNERDRLEILKNVAEMIMMDQKIISTYGVPEWRSDRRHQLWAEATLPDGRAYRFQLLEQQELKHGKKMLYSRWHSVNRFPKNHRLLRSRQTNYYVSIKEVSRVTVGA